MFLSSNLRYSMAFSRSMSPFGLRNLSSNPMIVPPVFRPGAYIKYASGSMRHSVPSAWRSVTIPVRNRYG